MASGRWALLLVALVSWPARPADPPKDEKPQQLDPVTVYGNKLPLRIDGTDRYMPILTPDKRATWSAGCVKLGYTIRKDGLADGFQFIESKPAGEFEEIVLRSAMRWKFSPREEPLKVIEIFKFENGITKFSAHLDCVPGAGVGPGRGVDAQGAATSVRGGGQKLSCTVAHEPTCSDR